MSTSVEQSRIDSRHSHEHLGSTGTPAPVMAEETHPTLEKKRSHSTDSFPEDKERGPVETHTVRESEKDVVVEDEEPSWYARHRVLVNRVTLFALAAVILGWWITSTILPATRHRWIVQTFWAWAFIIIIAFRFIPNSIVTRPVEAIWLPLVQRPWFALPRTVRYSLGWVALFAIVFGSAFGFPLTSVRALFCSSNLCRGR